MRLVKNEGVEAHVEEEQQRQAGKNEDREVRAAEGQKVASPGRTGRRRRKRIGLDGAVQGDLRHGPRLRQV